MRKCIVAIVEDDASMRRGVERLLGALGFGTEGYDSAEAFLGSLPTSKAECVVADIHLDGMSGIVLRRRLTAAGSTLPVIFITAIDQAGVKQEALESGCVAYLRKPFPAELLIRAINQALTPLAD